MAHILAIDDEQDVITLMTFLLQKDGHRISSAHNGAKALEVLGVEPAAPRRPEDLPDLIILDLMMPVMDGPGFARRLNRVESLSSIPMIILSAKGKVQEFFELPNRKTLYLEKPFDPKELRRLIAEILGEGAPE
ncbi:MAG: response regulator [Elusimicrobiota bacterium]